MWWFRFWFRFCYRCFLRWWETLQNFISSSNFFGLKGPIISFDHSIKGHHSFCFQYGLFSSFEPIDTQYCICFFSKLHASFSLINLYVAYMQRNLLDWIFCFISFMLKRVSASSNAASLILFLEGLLHLPLESWINSCVKLFARLSPYSTWIIAPCVAVAGALLIDTHRLWVARLAATQTMLRPKSIDIGIDGVGDGDGDARCYTPRGL